MKRDKAFLELGSKTLLALSVETLQQINSENISIVIAENSDKFQDYCVITDIYKNRGTLGGIHSALTNCDEEFALVIACDYPFISAELLNFLLKNVENNDEDCVAPIQSDGIIQPLCAIYRTENCLKILTAILEEFDETPSARDFLKRIDTKFIEFKEFQHLENAENFFLNINTPEEFEKAVAIHNER